jgi:phage terminase large subunit-like protein
MVKSRVPTSSQPMVTLTDWRNWPYEQKQELVRRLQNEIYARKRGSWKPYPWQRPPSTPDTHGTWLLLGGRGTGKTEGGAHYLDEHMMGPPCDPRLKGGHRAQIIAPTLGDAAESCVDGVSGLRTLNPLVKMRTMLSGTKVIWPNGAEAKLFGAYTAEDVERLRAGGNRCVVWLEEAAAMRHLKAAMEHSDYGLRIGHRPHRIATTTPKPRAEIRELVANPRTIVTRGRTKDATHLDEKVRERLYERYLGTRLGRQELEGDLLEDTEGALWTWRGLETDRVADAPILQRAVVGVDPAASNTEDSDETGIIVAGIHNGHVYVVDDLSGRYDPEEWGRIAVEAAERWDARYIVAEKNNGGDMVGTVLKTCGGGGRFKLVSASRGKQIRAEPVSVLYARHRVHHVGVWPALEDQMTTWTPEDRDSPDRMDALVWAVTHLAVPQGRGGVASAA